MGTHAATTNNNQQRSMSPSPSPSAFGTNPETSPSTTKLHQTQASQAPAHPSDDDRPLSRHRQTAVTTNGRLQRTADSSAPNQNGTTLRQQMSSVVDSGYGSLDKLRTPSTDLSNGAAVTVGRGHIGGAPYLSPVLSRRTKPSFSPPPVVQQTSRREYTTRKPSSLQMRNQELLVETRETPDDGDEAGFVHVSTTTNHQRDRSASRKDTAYDRFVSSK